MYPRPGSFGLLVALTASLGAASPARACATCGCGDSTLTATGVEKPYKNRIRVALEERMGSFSQGEPGVGQHSWFLRSALTGSWSPQERVTLGALLPWVSAWLDEGSKPQQTVNGLGDLELSGRVLVFRERRFAPHHLLWGLAGLKAPTGYRVYDESGHPFPDDDQPGSGSWDPFFAATYAWFGEPLALFASTSYRVTTPNERGYRRGSQLGWSAFVQFQPWSWGAFGAGLEGHYTQADTLLNGNAVPNTGGTVLNLAPAVMAMPLTDLLLRLVVDVPIVHVLNGVQTMGTQVTLQIAYDIR
jgi:hypothetical protein